MIYMVYVLAEVFFSLLSWSPAFLVALLSWSPAFPVALLSRSRAGTAARSSLCVRSGWPGVSKLYYA